MLFGSSIIDTFSGILVVVHLEFKMFILPNQLSISVAISVQFSFFFFFFMKCLLIFFLKCYEGIWLGVNSNYLSLSQRSPFNLWGQYFTFVAVFLLHLFIIFWSRSPRIP